MIKKYYEVACDKCGTPDYLKGTLKSVERQAIDLGWIITSGGKVYCGKACQDKAGR